MEKPRLMVQVRLALETHRYSPNTIDAYLRWIRQYIHFHDLRHPKDLEPAHVNAFLTHLACARKLSASAQTQALSALLFIVVVAPGLTNVPSSKIGPGFAQTWPWQFVFPHHSRLIDSNSAQLIRPHQPKRTVQRMIKSAANRAGINKPVTCHTLRHSFATHLIENGMNIREVQELLGHKDVNTTMIYIHTSQLRTNSIISPIDESF